jgi:LysR family transcriptional regulator, transcription activator of glutamate synthase operon
MGLDTDALRWFQQVADGTTVTEVGEAEAVTQSGVSRALARLEAEIGTPLLRKSGRTLRMTQAGAVFKHYVDALLHQLDDGIAAVGQLDDPDAGTVTLAFSPSLGTWLVPDLVASFRAAHPSVQFALTELRDELRAAPLDGGRADLEIGIRRPADPEIEARLVAVEPLRIALSATHPLAARPAVALAALAAEPFVALGPGSALRQFGDELCARAGFTPRVVFEGGDLATVRSFVAAGLGVAIVPAPRAGGPASRLSYAEISDVRAVRELTISWPATRRLPRAADRFRRHVIARAAAGLVPAAV